MHDATWCLQSDGLICLGIRGFTAGPHPTPAGKTSTLFNGMIAPFIGLQFSGIVWYQVGFLSLQFLEDHVDRRTHINSFFRALATSPLRAAWNLSFIHRRRLPDGMASVVGRSLSTCRFELLQNNI